MTNPYKWFSKYHCEKTTMITFFLISVFLISVYYAAIQKMTLLSNDLILVFGVSGIAGWIGVIWYRKEGKKSLRIYLIGLVAIVTIFIFYPTMDVHVLCTSQPCDLRLESIFEIIIQHLKVGY